MDNNNNQNKNGKNPKGGQNYMVLIITMIFTLLCVSAMHNLWRVQPDVKGWGSRFGSGQQQQD